MVLTVCLDSNPFSYDQAETPSQKHGGGLEQLPLAGQHPPSVSRGACMGADPSGHRSHSHCQLRSEVLGELCWGRCGFLRCRSRAPKVLHKVLHGL